MKLRIVFFIGMLLLSVVTVSAQSGSPKVQEFYAQISAENSVAFFDLLSMRADTTIYVYAESDDFDTYIAVCDIECKNIFADNDNLSSGSPDSALQYTFETAGDYSIAVADCCDEEAEGVFHLLVGFNAPDVLDGTAAPNGARIATPFEATYIPAAAGASSEGEVQEFVASVGGDVRFTYFDIYDARAGDTLYIYAESDEIDTYLVLCDIECSEVLASNDDIEEGDTNSALEYTFAEDGDYSIAVADCCEEGAEGTFYLLLGYGVPEVLTGDAAPTGAEIAVPYDLSTIESESVTSSGAVQEFFGQVDSEVQAAFFDIEGAAGGDTLYIYAESDEIDTYVVVCDITCENIFAEKDDIGSGNTNSALEFTFPADGDYSVAVLDCCDEEAKGSFRLLLGYDAPEVLTGDAVPNEAQIAVPYQPGEAPAVTLTGEPQIQEFYSVVSQENEFVYFDLFGMQAGTTIYLYAEADDFDTWLVVCDIDCEETFAENDDIGDGNTNSALQYTFTEDGDYSIAISDCCRSDVKGIFHLLIGFNAPSVLTGEAVPNGARIAVPYEPTYTEVLPGTVEGDAQVQQFVGQVTPETQFVYYDIFDATAGETLYLYAESSKMDTYLVVCDIECAEVFAENDDISERNSNSALEFTFPADGDYSIAIADCCDEEAIGSFRLLLGYNAPAVLTGEATPNGAEIAEPYEPNRVTAGTADRTETVNCENAQLTERPELSGPEQTVGTDNFLLHYTLQGEDAADEAFVNQVLSFVENVLEIQTQQLGWPAPPRDCGEGGDMRFDFYFEEILTQEEILGYAQPGNVVGDNPNSPNTETWAAYSFMTVDNDFRGADDPMGVMRATVAHEFHHAIQFGYDIADAFNWYYEATASWIETQTSPQDQDATNYTEAVFLYPDLCIGTLNEDTGVRIYGEWLLIDSLAQDYGPDSIIRLWELIADNEGMDSYYGLLDELGTTPQDALRHYAVRNLLRDYDLGDAFPATVSIEGAVNGTGDITPRFNGVQEMSADYVLIRRKGTYTLAVDSNNLSIVVVGIDRGSDEATVFDLGQRGTVDTTGFDNAYLIILNNDQHSDINACTTTDWTLSVTDGSGTTQAAANGEVFSARHFAPAG